MKMNAVVQILSFILPWFARRYVLTYLFGYSIHPSASIGFSIVLAKKLTMGPRSRIGHGTLINAIDIAALGEASKIGNLNWISGIPSRSQKHFGDEPDRRPELRLGSNSSITGRHFIDCCNTITIGDFTTVAGLRSQILSHAIDIKSNKQVSAPVRIGNYCFVGTGVIILKGAALPDFSVLAAGSTLNKAHAIKYGLYSGVPALNVKELDPNSLYFSRHKGSVD